MAFLNFRLKLNPATGSKDPYWLIHRRIEGRQVASAIGWTTEAEANRALRVFDGELAKSGVDPLRKTEPTCSPVTPLTIGEMWGYDTEPWACRLTLWLDATAAAPKSVGVYRASRKHIVRLLGGIKLKDITAAHGDQLAATLRSQGYAPRTLQIVRDHLCRSLQLAVEDGHLAVMPTIRRPKVPRKTERACHTAAQTEALLVVLEDKATQGRAQERRTHLAVLLAVSLGMRTGEVTHLRWERVRLDMPGEPLADGQPRTVGELDVADYIVGDRTRDWRVKCESHRTLPLDRALTEALRAEWIRQGQPQKGWVLANRDDPSRPLGGFREGLASACKAAGVPELHPHALRRTAETRWLAMGVDVPTAMRLGGWATPDVLLEIYAQTTADRKRAAIERTAPGAHSRGTS